MRLSRIVLILLAAVVLYLLVKPVPIEPVAWQPSPAPKLEGPYAANNALAQVEWLGRGVVHGPESTAIASDGRVYMGSVDGQIQRFDPKTSQFDTFARTGGRPLGMQFEGTGNLIVCDIQKGLLSVSPSGEVTTLSTEESGVPYRFTDDVDIASDGTIYFSDASSKFGKDQYKDDIFEHAGHGRFFAYHPATKTLERLGEGLFFANGVALSGDQTFVLVNETASYRIRRYWLSGPKKGTSDVFVDNLPGFPDNLSFSKTRGIFWVALFAPRDPIVDAGAPYPFLRKVLVRIPEALQPKPKRQAFVLGIDPEGKVVANLQDPSPESFSPVTSVKESGGYLYLGSLMREALGRVKAP